MGRSICFYGDMDDYLALEAFAVSLGLHPLPMQLNRERTPDPENGPGCYLSVVPRGELHPYGKPPVRITDVNDPMLFFMRPYFKNPYLVLGHLAWNDDDEDLGRVTRPYFNKMSAWVKKNWASLSGGDVRVGPGGRKLIELGAQCVNVHPDTPIDFKIVYVRQTGA